VFAGVLVKIKVALASLKEQETKYKNISRKAQITKAFMPSKSQPMSLRRKILSAFTLLSTKCKYQANWTCDDLIFSTVSNFFYRFYDNFQALLVE
jgi:hypothetical protein